MIVCKYISDKDQNSRTLHRPFVSKAKPIRFTMSAFEVCVHNLSYGNNMRSLLSFLCF